jgi:integrase
MIAHCRNVSGLQWLGHVVAILACTGLRMGELASLRWSDIDFTEQMLRLTDQTSMRRKTVRARRQTKTGHSRSFPINPDLMAVLQKISKSSRYVIEGPTGGQLQHDKVLRAFVRDVVTPLTQEFPALDEETGFADGRLHSFRHFFCSTCANNNVPEQMVMRWLGHRSSEMVRHYYHLHDDEAKRRMNQLNFLGEVGGWAADETPQTRGDGGLIKRDHTRPAKGSDLAH